MEPRVPATPPVVTALIAGAGLELGDALTFVAMAVRSASTPTVGELGVLAALVVPRLVFAALCAHTAKRAAIGIPGVAVATVGLLVLLAVQSAAGLFLLWGMGATVGGRVVLMLVFGVAATSAAASYWPHAVRLPVRRRAGRDVSG